MGKFAPACLLPNTLVSPRSSLIGRPSDTARDIVPGHSQRPVPRPGVGPLGFGFRAFGQGHEEGVAHRAKRDADLVEAFETAGVVAKAIAEGIKNACLTMIILPGAQYFEPS